jgi:hypothetical protein
VSNKGLEILNRRAAALVPIELAQCRLLGSIVQSEQNNLSCNVSFEIRLFFDVGSCSHVFILCSYGLNPMK